MNRILGRWNVRSQPGLEPRARIAYCASALTEQLRPDILTDSHTPGYPMTCTKWSVDQFVDFRSCWYSNIYRLKKFFWAVNFKIYRLTDSYEQMNSDSPWKLSAFQDNVCVLIPDIHLQ